MRIVAALTLATAVVSAQQHDHGVPETLGRVAFSTSCSKDVAPAFNRAVALLHSFSFAAARQAFEDVLAKDASCAMAHWGIALTHWGNPFAALRPVKALDAGRASVERARTTGRPTQREQDYIAAVAALYDGHQTVDQRTRVVNYARAMEQVYATYPQDGEAAAFYALALTQTALPTDKTYAQQLKAAAILEQLWKDQPEHPGLAHYIIHAYDHPPLAARALAAARRYAKIAPSAPHALHMPSHTFTRVGYWQESIETNIASAEAALREGVVAEALHAMDYQVYAYLQTGQDAAARRLLEEARRLQPKLAAAVEGAAPAPAGYYALAAIPARYAMERGAWSDAAALEFRPTQHAWIDAVTRFARSVGASRSGQPQQARADLAELRQYGAALAAAGNAEWSEVVAIQQQIAEAWLTFAEGRHEEAVALLRKAADAEDATDKIAISPGPLAPAREMLGEMLLELNRPQAALDEFEATLTKEPNRFRATYNAAKAAIAAGNRAAGRKYFAQLLGICQAGDAPGRPELQEARAFTAS